MSNPLFNMMGGNQMQGGIMQRFHQFQQMFRGNPQQQIQQMLNSGKVSQGQYNKAVQMANQFRQMLGK